MGKTTAHIDDQLIKGCRENDRDSQFELYKKYYRQMYNTSLRIVNNTAEAEDIMQDSFLDAFRKIDDYSGEGSFGGWLRRIVVNNSIDALKKKKREVPFEEETMDVAGDDTSYDRSRETVEYRIEEIKKAMDSMNEDYRVIISLFLFEGYDHEEIAGILNISYGASRTRYSRARQKLLDTLAEHRSINIIHPN